MNDKITTNKVMMKKREANENRPLWKWNNNGTTMEQMFWRKINDVKINRLYAWHRSSKCTRFWCNNRCVCVCVWMRAYIEMRLKKHIWLTLKDALPMIRRYSSCVAATFLALDAFNRYTHTYLCYADHIARSLARALSHTLRRQPYKKLVAFLLTNTLLTSTSSKSTYSR